MLGTVIERYLNLYLGGKMYACFITLVAEDKHEGMLSLCLSQIEVARIVSCLLRRSSYSSAIS